MSAGFPDFFRGIDITYQSLAQIMNRPKYGGAGIEQAAGPVVANATSEIISVSGKGMIYGGSLVVSWTSSQKNGRSFLEVDGIEISALDFESSNFFNFTTPSSSPFYLLVYDDIRFRYSFGVAPGITFESSFRVLYTETQGSTPGVSCGIVYALI